MLRRGRKRRVLVSVAHIWKREEFLPPEPNLLARCSRCAMMGLRHGSAEVKTGSLADGLTSDVGKVAFNLTPYQLFQFLKNIFLLSMQVN